jgi:hypothetical protein
MAFTPRYVVLTLCFLLTIVLVTPIGASMLSGWDIPLAVGASLFGALMLLGFHDIFQTRHAVRRNYPISAHLPFLLEDVRPERQDQKRISQFEHRFPPRTPAKKCALTWIASCEWDQPAPFFASSIRNHATYNAGRNSSVSAVPTTMPPIIA